MKKIVKQLFLYFILFIIIKTILSYFISAPSAFSDGYIYSKMARSFFNSLEFSVHGIPTNHYPPFYPIILSISYLFKDMISVFLTMKIINVIISSLILFPAWLLSKEFLSEKKALISAILISIIPSNFAFAPYLMSENLFYPLFLFAIYFIYKSFVQNNYKYSILAGLFVALSTLTKTFGIILLALFILLIFIQFIRKKSQPNPLIFLIIFFLVMSPWILRNFSLSGFSPTTITGAQSRTALKLSTDILSFNFYIQIILYLCYIILATGILFSITSISYFKNIFKNEKYLLFSLITLFVTFSMLIICANHGGSRYIFEWLGGRPLGRYIETLLPLIFITGFIGLDSYKKNKEKYFKIITLIFVPILIFSSFLATFPLFPINNMSLTWVGSLRYIFEYIFYNKTSFDIIHSWPSLIFLAIIFLLILSFIFLLSKRLSFKKIISIFIIFFLFSSLLNYAVTYHNADKFWYKGEQMQLGIWFNSYNEEKSNILFDKRDCGEKITKQDQSILCDPAMTIMGFWMNDKIRVGDISEYKNFDYIISKHKLDFPLVKSKGDFYIYKI